MCKVPTEEKKRHLRKLLSSVQVDKITVSFSIEDRDRSGRKKGAFVSVTASRGAGAEVPQMQESGPSVGYTPEEARFVRLFLSREVVRATYDDAFRREVLIYDEASRSERDRVIKNYDKVLEALGGSEGEEG
jgi:hypothetical protein